MRRQLYLLVGALGYLSAIVPMVIFVGFVGNLGIPCRIDAGSPLPRLTCLLADLALLLSFAVVHSALARPSVKARLSRHLPPDLERSLYSAIAGAQILLLEFAWRPLPRLVWSVEAPLARFTVWGLFWLGWAVVIAALWAIDERELFGLRRAWAAARDRPYAPPPFAVRGPYLRVRHPLYSGTILALFAAPDMSLGRLLLAVLLTLYILIGATFEERDLAKRWGESFADYRRTVPAYLPRPGRRFVAPDAASR